MNEKKQEIESKLWKVMRHSQNKKKIQESLVIKKEEQAEEYQILAELQAGYVNE